MSTAIAAAANLRSCVGYRLRRPGATPVIDGWGNVRFKLVGFDGSKEGTVDELSMAIDMAEGESQGL